MDTSPFIYQLEANPKYIALTRPVFDWLELPGHAAVTSTITMAELLVQPYRGQDLGRVKTYFALLSTFPHLDWVAPSLDIADVAARLRAEHRLRTPDAIHAATAVRSGVTGFVSNDPSFQRVKAFETLLLDEVV